MLPGLVRAELRLARAELSDTISKGMQAGIWMAAAGVIALLAVFLLLQGIVFGLANLGLAVHWSCLIVAAVLAGGAGLHFYYGRSLAHGALMPKRTVHQIGEDISAVREQLT